ncbi:MAG: COG2426 family protein [Candidatus Excrementavichristensenella sp.]|jgi:uncharacterized membrane protein|nr:small multi-drug export protein [Bacillota bacterium]NLL53981.1 small multi-drug export protein [Clostridiales bacterium]
MGTGFIWSEHLRDIVVTGLLSMVPTFEGRYALTIGMGLGMPLLFTYLLAVVCSTVPMPFIFWLMKPILKWLYSLPIGFVRKFAAWVERRSQRMGEKVDAKGLLGLYLFVAVPLPGTGVWTGSAVATVLNMKKSHAMIAIVLGNMTACLIMTLVMTGVLHFF